MTAPVRLALVGYGLSGQVFHRPLIRAVPDLRLTHVVTGDPVRAARARAEAPSAVVLPSADQLWGRAEEYDAVVVATPPATHVALGTAAVELGKAVVVDKPFAPTAEQARRLVDLAARRGVPLTVFANRRWDSDTLTLGALLRDGALGRVLRVESRFQRFRPEVAQRWREQPEADGGVLLDLGPHLVDQVLHLLGPASSVYAEVGARRPGARVDDDCLLALRHVGGASSLLWCSLVAPTGGPRLRAEGTRAGVVVADLDGQEAALRDGWDPAGGGWGTEPPATLTDSAGSRPLPALPGCWGTFYEAFAAAVRGAGPVPVDPDDGVRVLAVLDAARLSAADRQVVALS